MDKNYELKYHRLEENYWWFSSRRDLIFGLIENLKPKKDANILEVGCSGGPLLAMLEHAGFSHLTGIDISGSAIELCKERGLTNTFVMAGEKTSFHDARFDLIIASDILEHIQNDVAALNEWYRLLKPGGTLLVFVPAFTFLWSRHDDINHHYTRYTKTSLHEKLERAHFKILRSSYWNSLLFSPVAAVRLMQKILRKKEISKNTDHLYEINPLINKCLIAILQHENKLIKKLNFPFGVSVFAVCTKE